MNKLQSLVLAITLYIVSVSVATAQDFDKGLDAYSAGDYQTALREWRPLADRGESDVQFNMGVMYYSGRGVPQDYAEAEKWWRLAAEQGNADAQNNLGAMYQLGAGVLQSNVMAHMWYNIASANGDPRSGERRDKRAGLMTSTDISGSIRNSVYEAQPMRF